MAKSVRYIKLGKAVSKIVSGITPRGGESNYKTRGVPLIRSQNVREDFLDLSDVVFIDQEQHKRMSRSEVHPRDVLLNITGASIGRSCVVPEDIGVANVNQHVCVIRCQSQINPFFLSLYLNSWFGQKQICSFQGGGSREGLNYEQIALFDMPLFSEQDQKVIVQTIGYWNEVINKLGKLIQIKRSLVAALTREYVAKESGGKSVQLRKICDPVLRRNAVGDTNVLTSSAQRGLISQTTYYSKSVSGAEIEKYYLLKKGEFAYNRSAAQGYPFGAIKRLDSCEQGALSTLYMCFRIIDLEMVDSDYLCHYFDSGILNRDLRNICQTGARSHGLLNVSKGDFYNLSIKLPALKKQRAVSAALNLSRQEIAVLINLVDMYQKQKRGLVEKLLTGQWRIKN